MTLRVDVLTIECSGVSVIKPGLFPDHHSRMLPGGSSVGAHRRVSCVLSCIMLVLALRTLAFNFLSCLRP